MSEEDRQRKQEYLVNSVQRRGYDTEKFAYFLNSKRENGTNVDVWTFEDLQKVSADADTVPGGV